MKSKKLILKDYFYGRLTRKQEEGLQEQMGKEGLDEAEDNLEELLNELPSHDPALAQRGFHLFLQQLNGYRSKPTSSVRTLLLWTQRVAALLILPLIMAWVYQYHQSNKQNEWIDISVARGSQQELKLPDGSVLHLNSGTRVIYPKQFGSHSREIFVSGELFADIAKDPSRPFVISAGDTKVQVLGTQFNFRAYNNIETVELALLQGSVVFEAPEHQPSQLQAGELIQYHRGTGSLHRESFLSQQYKSPSRKEGFCFNNVSLGDIAKELEYYFAVDIVILNEELSNRCFIAYFANNETLDEILSDLNYDGRMQVHFQGNSLYIDQSVKNNK